MSRLSKLKDRRVIVALMAHGLIALLGCASLFNGIMAWHESNARPSFEGSGGYVLYIIVIAWVLFLVTLLLLSAVLMWLLPPQGLAYWTVGLAVCAAASLVWSMSHKRAAIAEKQALVSQQRAEATQTVKAPQSRLVFSEPIESPLLTPMALALRDALRAEPVDINTDRLAALTAAVVKGTSADRTLIEVDQLSSTRRLMRWVVPQRSLGAEDLAVAHVTGFLLSDRYQLIAWQDRQTAYATRVPGQWIAYQEERRCELSFALNGGKVSVLREASPEEAEQPILAHLELERLSMRSDDVTAPRILRPQIREAGPNRFVATWHAARRMSEADASRLCAQMPAMKVEELEQTFECGTGPTPGACEPTSALAQRKTTEVCLRAAACFPGP
ncbi:hypothetical protein [Piscinibacterium candidicorallinum]|uniref:Transmembrane protein n=1 Tax=Piscinibacterium candidicorallinum TaxID=1793872 RepID=A0ABV7H346_9BURK